MNGPSATVVVLLAAAIAIAVAFTLLLLQGPEGATPAMVLVAGLGLALLAALAVAAISRRRQARLNAELEQMAARLAQQSQQLQRAERAQHELLARVSHDLRTPLASMQGYLELLMLQRGKLDPAEEHNYLQTALRQSERLSRLVRDLFELTRLESTAVPPSGEDFALADLAHDTVQGFAREAGQRALQLAVVPPADGHSRAGLVVHADIGLIARALQGVVENALRHTPAGGSVTIELGSSAGRAQIVVRDTGEGIAAEALPGLFERYRHNERVGDGGPQGHGGLGLAIARRIVRLHGGELCVASTRGQGTQVSLDLPLADASRPAATPQCADSRRTEA
jgi:signal transduction histidine kinase